MGNQPTKHSGSSGRPKKAVHWKSAEPPSPPGKPMLVPGTPDSSAPDIVTLRWKRPTSDGGSPILGYIVEHRRTGSPHWVRATAVLIQATELSFSGLEPGWRYQFRVTAQNIVGQSDCSELSDALTVTLQRAAIAPPRFIHELYDTTAIENEKIEFRVSVAGTPAPQISWFKDGFEMFSSRRTKILSEGDFSVLVIHQAALTDEGEIKCTATNSAGSAATICNLSIDAYPKIRLPRQYEDGLIIEADEVIRLKVGLAGQPTPMVEWSHNGEVLTNGGRYEIETSDKNSSLRISNAQRSDRGEYNLRAINKLGEDYASFLVTVTAKPEPPGKITVSMSLGTSVTLSWAEPEDDGGCKIGNYIVEYYRLGWDVWLKASTCRQLTTTLSGLIEGSQYRFRVKAENPYGLSEPSQESDTVFIPDPKRGINSAAQIHDNKEDKECQTPLIVPRKRREESRSPAREAEQVKKAKAFTPETYSRDEIVREMSYGARDEDFFKPKPPQEPPKQTIVPSVVVTEPAPVPEPKPSLPPQPQRPQSFTSPLKAMEKFSKEPSPLAFRSSDNSLAPREAASPTSPDKSAIHNSSEFMLVLYNEREAKNNTRNSTFDFELEDLAAPPPPLSLSAPELNVEPPPAPAMRPAVSSTELLYERAMARFYQAVAMEESENQRKEAEHRRRGSVGGGGTEQHHQQNGGQDAVARLTDRRSSLRRRLSGDKEAIVKQSSFESADGRQHSSTVDSVIPEEEHVEEGDIRGAEEEIKEHSIVDEVLEELDEDVGSISGSIDSFMEELKRRESARSSRSRVMSDEEEEMETYHPRQRLVSPYRNPDPSQAIEVLTKPLPMPDPNFVPKPILKRPSTEVLTRDEKDKKEVEVERVEAQPPVVQELKEEKKAVPPSKPERKSLMNFLERKSPAKEEPPKVVEREKTPEEVKPVEREKTPEVVKPEEVEAPLSEKQGPTEEQIKQAIVQEAARQKRRVSRQNSEEEAKAIANFYGEILERVESSKKPRKLPLYSNPDELRKLNSRETSYDRFTRSRSGSASPMPPEDIYRAQKSRSPSLTSEQIVLKGKPARESKILRQRSASIETEPARPASVVKDVPVVPPTPPKPEAPPKLETAFIPSAYDEPVRKSRPLRESTAIAKKRNVSSTRSSRNSSATRDAESVPDSLEAARRARLRSASKSPSALQRTQVTLTPPPPPAVEPPKPPTPTPTPAKEPPLPEQRSRSQSQSREPPVDPQDESLKYTLSYLTDVALFVFACWLYLFKNPKWAIPVIALIMFRQIKDAMRDRMPPWVRRSLGTDS